MRVRMDMRVTLMALLAAAITLTVVLGGFGRARAASEAPGGTTPGEMTAAQATELVVTRFGREDAGVLGPIAALTVHSTFAEADTVVNGESPSAAVYGGPAAIAEWRSSPVYTVVMRASPGARFEPNVPHPPGTASPAGAVMSVVVDARTGRKYSMNLEPSVPEHLSELGAATETNEPALTTAAIAALPSHRDGLLVGHLYVHGRPKSGWRILVGKTIAFVRGPTARQDTGPPGVFTFRLPPGSYRIVAWRPTGGTCGTASVRVSSHGETRIKLTCV